MGARTRKIRSDLLTNTTRSFLAVVSLAVGTMAVGGMYLAGTTVEDSFDSSFLASNPPSAMLRTEPFPASLITAVVDHPAVSEAEGRRLLQTRVSGAGGAPISLEVVAMPDFADNHVAQIVPTSGAWPPATGAMIVERASLAELASSIGEDITLDVPGRPSVDLTVTGTAFDVYEIAPTLGGLPRAYVSMETMIDLTGSAELDAIYLRAAEQPLDREQAIAATAAVRDDVLEPANVSILVSEIRDPAQHRASSSASFMVAAMQVLSLLALAIAVTLIVNTVTSLLAEQRRQVGVMKAVGATSGQLTMQYLGYVLALALVAIVIAVPLSMFTGRFIAGFTADLANFDLEPLGVPWATIAIVMTIAAALPVAAVLFSVRRASRVTVSETIVDRGITAVGAGRHHAVPFARPTVLAYRNAVRNRSRLVLTLVTIGVSGGVLVGVFGTGRSLDDLTDQVAGYWDYDVEVRLTETTSIEHASAVLERQESVLAVEGWLSSQAFRIRPDGTENENISVTGVPPDSPSLAPTLLTGRWLDDADVRPIVINTHFADEEPDLTVGDTVLLDVEGNRGEWEIVGVSTTTLMGPVAYVPVDDLAADIGRPGATNLLAIQLEPGAVPVDSAERIEAAAFDAGLPVGQVQTNADLRATLDGLFAIVVGLLLVVGAILAVIAIVGVAGTMALGVIEQTREIGVLRTIGASDWAVRRLLLMQGLVIAAAGCLLGAVLSVPVTLLLNAAISDNLIAASLPASFSPVGLGMWVIVAAVIGAVSSTRPARVAAKLTVRDTLSYE